MDGGCQGMEWGNGKLQISRREVSITQDEEAPEISLHNPSPRASEGNLRLHVKIHEMSILKRYVH